MVSQVYVDDVLKAEGIDSFTYRPSAFDFSEHSIFVRFVPSEGNATLEVTSEGEGTVAPFGTKTFVKGEVARVVAEPASGNIIDDVLVDGRSVGASNVTDVVMDADHSVKVVFRPVSSEDIPVMVSVDIDIDIVVESLGADTEFGHVTPMGTVYVKPHSSLKLLIELNPGFEVNDICIDGSSKGSVTEYDIEDIVKPVDVRISIVKKVPGVIIKASAGPGGSISPFGDVKVAKGDDATFILSPSSGYRISHLFVDGKKVQVAGSRYIFENVTSAHTIEAVFAYSGSPSPTKSLTSISVTGAPTVCYYGETLDTSGMIVTANYSDGSSEQVSASISGFSSTTTGSQTVTVTYGSKTASFIVTIPTLNGMSVVSGPSVTTFQKGSVISLTELVVQASYSEGSTYARDVNPVVPTVDSGTVGEKQVIISYSEGSMTVTAEVTVMVVDGSGFTAEVTGFTGTKVDPDGRVVPITGTYSGNFRDFRFETQNIVPGVSQSVSLKITNNTGMDLPACVFVSAFTGDPGLAGQIFLTCGTAGGSVKDLADSTFVDLGTIHAGETEEFVLTMSFPNSPDNNSVMGKTLSFSIGVFAGQESDAPLWH